MTDTTDTTRVEEAAHAFLAAESDLRSEANERAARLRETMIDAWLANPFAEAAIAALTQTMLERRMWTEANSARKVLGQRPGYVPPFHDPNLWKHFEDALVHAAQAKADDAIEEYRLALAAYATGQREEPPRWPMIEVGEA